MVVLLTKRRVSKSGRDSDQLSVAHWVWDFRGTHRYIRVSGIWKIAPEFMGMGRTWELSTWKAMVKDQRLLSFLKIFFKKEERTHGDFIPPKFQIFSKLVGSSSCQFMSSLCVIDLVIPGVWLLPFFKGLPAFISIYRVRCLLCIPREVDGNTLLTKLQIWISVSHILHEKQREFRYRYWLQLYYVYSWENICWYDFSEAGS